MRRSRATFKLKADEKCPRERKCQISGECKRRGRTIEEICAPERMPGDPNGCKLFFTKPDSTPIEFLSFFQAAMILREARLISLVEEMRIAEQSYPFWAIDAYKIAERAFREVEAEIADDPEGKKVVKNNLDIEAGNDDGGVFRKIVAHKRAQRAMAEMPELDALQEAWDADPELSEKIFASFREEYE